MRSDLLSKSGILQGKELERLLSLGNSDFLGRFCNPFALPESRCQLHKLPRRPSSSKGKHALEHNRYSSGV
jgi:hypothetical protein